MTIQQCDASDETQVQQFRDGALHAHERDSIELLFNNAGIGGGGSFVAGDREEWDRTFGVTWGGVYVCSRVFMPCLVRASAACIVNTSSVNGFWASLGPGIPHTAYSSAKFAEKGFTEALQEDLRVNAPHVRAVLVMPGHIGTEIVRNTYRAHGGTDDAAMETFATMFRERAPLSAAQAATIILDAVRAGEWRVLVGDDAHALDRAVRDDPLGTYGPQGLRLS